MLHPHLLPHSLRLLLSVGLLRLLESFDSFVCSKYFTSPSSSSSSHLHLPLQPLPLLCLGRVVLLLRPLGRVDPAWLALQPYSLSSSGFFGTRTDDFADSSSRASCRVVDVLLPGSIWILPSQDCLDWFGSRRNEQQIVKTNQHASRHTIKPDPQHPRHLLRVRVRQACLRFTGRSWSCGCLDCWATSPASSPLSHSSGLNSSF